MLSGRMSFDAFTLLSFGRLAVRVSDYSRNGVVP